MELPVIVWEAESDSGNVVVLVVVISVIVCTDEADSGNVTVSNVEPPVMACTDEAGSGIVAESDVMVSVRVCTDEADSGNVTASTVEPSVMVCTDEEDSGNVAESTVEPIELSLVIDDSTAGNTETVGCSMTTDSSTGEADNPSAVEKGAELSPVEENIVTFSTVDIGCSPVVENDDSPVGKRMSPVFREFLVSEEVVDEPVEEVSIRVLGTIGGGAGLVNVVSATEEGESTVEPPVIVCTDEAGSGIVAESDVIVLVIVCIDEEDSGNVAESNVEPPIMVCTDDADSGNVTESNVEPSVIVCRDEAGSGIVVESEVKVSVIVCTDEVDSGNVTASTVEPSVMVFTDETGSGNEAESTVEPIELSLVIDGTTAGNTETVGCSTTIDSSTGEADNPSVVEKWAELSPVEENIVTFSTVDIGCSPVVENDESPVGKRMSPVLKEFLVSEEVVDEPVEEVSIRVLGTIGGGAGLVNVVSATEEEESTVEPPVMVCTDEAASGIVAESGLKVSVMVCTDEEEDSGKVDTVSTAAFSVNDDAAEFNTGTILVSALELPLVVITVVTEPSSLGVIVNTDSAGATSTTVLSVLVVTDESDQGNVEIDPSTELSIVETDEVGLGSKEEESTRFSIVPEGGITPTGSAIELASTVFENVDEDEIRTGPESTVDLSLNVEIFEAVDSGKVKDDSALKFISFSITDEPRPGNLVAIVSPAIFSEVEIVSMETMLLSGMRGALIELSLVIDGTTAGNTETAGCSTTIDSSTGENEVDDMSAVEKGAELSPAEENIVSFSTLDIGVSPAVENDESPVGNFMPPVLKELLVSEEVVDEPVSISGDADMTGKEGSDTPIDVIDDWSPVDEINASFTLEDDSEMSPVEPEDDSDIPPVEPEDDSDISPVEPEDGTSRVITVSTTFIVEMGVPTLEIVDTPSLVIDDVDKSAEDATEDVEEPSLIKVEALSTSTDGGLLSIEEEVSIRELGNTGGGGGLVNVSAATEEEGPLIREDDDASFIDEVFLIVVTVFKSFIPGKTGKPDDEDEVSVTATFPPDSMPME